MNGVDSNCFTTPCDTRKRRRYSSEPSPHSQINFQEEKKAKTLNDSTSECEPDIENKTIDTHKINKSINSSNASMSQTEGVAETETLPKVSITKDDILLIAKTVKELLQTDIEAIVDKKVAEKQQPLTDQIRELTIKNNELEEKCKLLEEIHTLKSNNCELDKKCQKLNDKCDDLEQHSRKSLLRFSGVEASAGENTTQKVVDIVKKIGVDINYSDIEVSHRTGKPVSGRPRSIIARIRNYELKKRILSAAKNLPATEGLGQISINQDLTKARDLVAYTARKFVRMKHLRATWVIDGKIYTIANDGKTYVFRKLEDLIRTIERVNRGPHNSRNSNATNLHLDTDRETTMDTAHDDGAGENVHSDNWH